MNNSALRKRSRKIWLSRFPSLLPISILMLMDCCLDEIEPQNPLVNLALYPVSMILTAIFCLLNAGFCLNAWQEQRQTLPRITLLQIGREALIEVLIQLPLWLVSALAYPLASHPETPVWMMVMFLIVFFAGIIFAIWLSIRLYPSDMLIYLDADLALGDCLKTLWAATKGHCGRILCMLLVLTLPAIPITVLVGLPLVVIAPDLWWKLESNMDLIMYVILLPYSCYTILASSALNLELLGRNPILPEDL